MAKINNIKVNRPTPITDEINVFPFDTNTNYKIAIEALTDGDFVLITDFYSTGLSLLSKLKKYLQQEYSNNSFQEQRSYRSIYQDLSNKILLDISNNKITVKKAPKIGWLQKLYPEIQDFALPFPQVQGLNSSWQWYKKGIFIPVLNEKIHPYYGTYFPTRFEHLELFNDFLKSYNGKKETAFDIGIGSGVLSFQMLKHHFEQIIATDTNSNSIIGLNEVCSYREEFSKIKLIYGNLFANNETKADLIVFNPPWLPANSNTEGLDDAIYYNSSLFSDFFKQAKKVLKPNGKIILLFSNLAQITGVCKTNPIEVEIANGKSFKKDLLLKKEVKSASSKTKRNQNWRSLENVELWVLSHK